MSHGRPRDIPAQPVQPLPISRREDHARMEVVAGAAGAEPGQGDLPARQALDLPGPAAGRHGAPPGDRRLLDQAQGILSIVLHCIPGGAEALLGEPALGLLGDVDDEPLDRPLREAWGAGPADRAPPLVLREQAVDQEHVEGEVEPKRGAESLDHGDAASLALRPADEPLVVRLDRLDGDPVHPLHEVGPPGEQVAAWPGDREHPLAHGHARKETFHPAICSFGHAAAAAADAEPSGLAGEGHQAMVPAVTALEPREALGRIAALDVPLDLADDVAGQAPARLLDGFLDLRPARAHHAVQEISWRAAALDHNRHGPAACMVRAITRSASPSRSAPRGVSKVRHPSTDSWHLWEPATAAPEPGRGVLDGLAAAAAIALGFGAAWLLFRRGSTLPRGLERV